MPRAARIISSSGYYHVINRGTGRQLLFEESTDFKQFLKILGRNAKEEKVTIIAYCLMDNHIHLLLHTDSRLDRFMKQVTVSYAMYFNKKYDRDGHLFQNRYRSEAIENDRYLLTVVRYIHNNPEKAGICRREDYPWSSWGEYCGRTYLVSTEPVLSLTEGYQGFLRFSKSVDHDDRTCLDINNGKRLTDQKALIIIKSELDLIGCTGFQTLNLADRNEVLRKLKQKGLSIRQLERLTGLGRNIISKA